MIQLRDKKKEIPSNSGLFHFVVRGAVSKMRRVFISVTLFLLLTAGTFSANAQGTTATLGGNVTDPQHNVVSNATVTVTSKDTDVIRTTTTNSVGAWRVDSLVAGRYTFHVESPGFATLEHSVVELQIGDQKFIDVSLKIGTVSDTVTVDSATPLIDTTAAVSGTVITTEQLQELPSLTNSALDFVALAPGVFLDAPSGGLASLWSTNSQSAITVNGAGSGTNAVNYTIDGATDTIVSNGQIAFIPPIDAVKEARITTSAYDASIGRTAAGTVNLSVKSGTSAFHGVLYERNQNSFLNANYYQYKATNTPTPAIRFNEWGGTVGGPVWIPHLYDGNKKGTYFFLSYDGVHNVSPAGAGFLSLPTALERTGDFSQSYTTNTVGGVTTTYPIIPYDPATINPSTGNRQPFPNAKIPSNRISPAAKAILDLLPLPNVPNNGQSNTQNNYLSNNPKVDDFKSLAFRFDQSWNNNHHSYVDVLFNDLSEISSDPFGSSNILAAQFLTRTNYGFILGHAWVLRPNLLIDVHANAIAWKTTLSSKGTGIDPTAYGFSSQFASSQLIKGLPQITGLFGTTIGTTAGPQYENDYEWEGKASVTHTVDRHTFHYGVDYLLQQEPVGNRSGGTGTYNFTNQWTTANPNTVAGPGIGSTNASFLLGLPSSGSIANAATALWSQPYVAGYFQDDWRATPRLTLNLGLRWDVQLALTERKDRYFARFDPTANIAPVTNYAQPNYATLIAGSSSNTGIQLLQQYRPNVAGFQAVGAIQYAGKDGVDRSLTNINYKYFQPRIGFAFQATPLIVIRGGYGRFVQANYTANHGNQLGYSSTTPFNATTDNYYTSNATLDNPYPNGLVPITGNSLGTLTSVGSVTNFWTPNVKRQYVDDFSLRIQQQVHNFLFEVGGVLERTNGLTVGYQVNNPGVDSWLSAFEPKFDASGRPVDTLPGNTQVTNPFYNAPYITGGLQNNKTVTAFQLLRPNPLVGGITYNLYTGTSTHYALQSKVVRRFQNGFGFMSSFSWGKQMDSTSFFTPSIVSQKLHRQLSPNDRRFQFTVSPTYVLPMGRGKWLFKKANRVTDSLVGGWGLSAVYSFYSGIPISLPTNTAFYQGGDPAEGTQKSPLQWFNTSKFAAFPTRSTTVAQLRAYPSWTNVAALPGYNWTPTSSSDATKNGVYNDFQTWVSDNTTTYGNVRNPYLNSWNIGLRKSFVFYRETKLQLRIDAFNALNHPRFGNVDTTPGDKYFGALNGSNVLSQVNTPRTIQLEGKLYF